MVDYQQIESDHLRRVGWILESKHDEDTKDEYIAALERFRDADIFSSERIEREAAEREQRGVKELTWAERSEEQRQRQAQVDAQNEGLLVAFISISGIAFIALGFIAAFVP